MKAPSTRPLAERLNPIKGCTKVATIKRLQSIDASNPLGCRSHYVPATYITRARDHTARRPQFPPKVPDSPPKPSEALVASWEETPNVTVKSLFDSPRMTVTAVAPITTSCHASPASFYSDNIWSAPTGMEMSPLRLSPPALKTPAYSPLPLFGNVFPLDESESDDLEMGLGLFDIGVPCSGKDDIHVPLRWNGAPYPPQAPIAPPMPSSPLHSESESEFQPQLQSYTVAPPFPPEITTIQEAFARCDRLNAQVERRHGFLRVLRFNLCVAQDRLERFIGSGLCWSLGQAVEEAETRVVDEERLVKDMEQALIDERKKVGAFLNGW